VRWLDGTDTILSYDRSYRGNDYVVILNDAASSQSITIDLGSRGIPCASARNLLQPGDPSIHLNDPGTDHTSLSATLQPWEPKVVRCAGAPAA
jgi:hypothetical protein